MTPTQVQLAIDKANYVRLSRAELKHRIAEGEITVSEILRDVPDYAETMSIDTLLMAQWKWGIERTDSSTAAKSTRRSPSADVLIVAVVASCHSPNDIASLWLNSSTAGPVEPPRD